jgi:hypothetical protein
MERVTLRRIKFGSYIKLTFVASFSTGLFIGCLGLLIALLGGNVTVNGEIVDYSTGIQVGLLLLVLFPLMWGGILPVFSIITFPMLKLVLKLLKGIKLNVMIISASGTAVDSINLPQSEPKNIESPSENLENTPNNNGEQ